VTAFRTLDVEPDWTFLTADIRCSPHDFGA
jgi:hypothetical protein